MRETMRCEWVKCGKKCGGCPHGPYWYAYWREGHKTRKRYVGKGSPHDTEGAAPEAPKAAPAEPHRWDAILSDRTATLALALEILGLRQEATLAEAKAAHRTLSFAQHPDRCVGESDMPFRRTQAAWSYVRTVLR